MVRAPADPGIERLPAAGADAVDVMLIDRAEELLTRLIPAPTQAQETEALLLAQERSTRLGLTMIHDAGRTGDAEDADWQEIERLRSLYDQGRYKLRVYKSVVGPGKGAQRLLDAGPSIGERGGRFTLRTIKLQIDGALGSRGAALLEPYSDEPGTRGLFRIEDQVLEPLFERVVADRTHLVDQGLEHESNPTEGV
ncbi:MAG: amidohydrolase family protein [Rhodospirillaceae bacterium]|nr:amidohydrolase family protein [Rhodospirillaceae bacterium]